MRSIHISDTDQVISILMQNGYRVIAPVKEKDFTLFREIKNADRVDFSQINPKNSIKEFFFPMNEKLFSFIKSNKTIEYDEKQNEKINYKNVIIGAKPCDAASLEVLSKLFNWDYRDCFFNERLKRTTIITFACDQADQTCFCTSVGGAPDNPIGSDVMFKKANGSYIVEAVSNKGRNILNLLKKILQKNEDLHPKIAEVEKKFELNMVKKNLEKNFDSELFRDFSNKCLGCGICAYLCPDCHCFDLIDEGNLKKGARYRNYDSCQFPLFTLHTSNHNPRPDKASRWRQRLMHKFSYFPDLFGIAGCEGCGRCIKNCPVSMDILKQLKTIAKL